jgi:phosphate transport system substrate-binding protein
LEYFRQAVLDGGPLRSGVRRYADAQALAAEFAGEGRVLAVAAAIPARGAGGKVLRVAAGSRSTASTPTPEHFHSGDYPLRLPLQLVFKPERRTVLAPVLEFLLSDEAARLLTGVDLVPLPAAVREETRRELLGGGR